MIDWNLSFFLSRSFLSLSLSRFFLYLTIYSVCIRSSVFFCIASFFLGKMGKIKTTLIRLFSYLFLWRPAIMYIFLVFFKSHLTMFRFFFAINNNNSNPKMQKRDIVMKKIRINKKSSSLQGQNYRK